MSKAYTILSMKSAETRLHQYYKMLKEYGYFRYPTGEKFHNNGIVEQGKKKIDLNEAIENDLIKIGDIKSSSWPVYSYSSSNNPNAFIIYKRRGLFPKEAISFDLDYDKDVFIYLLNSFKQRGKFIED